MIDVNRIKNTDELLRQAKWLEGKTLAEVSEEIKKSDRTSRVTTKGDAGYIIEKGFFGIEKNSDAESDIPHLGVEIKTCPLKYNSNHGRLSVKEPLSLNIINYCEEYKHKDFTASSVYKKNRKILFICYIHDPEKERSQYLIKYVFFWDIDKKVVEEISDDYNIIIDMIKRGRAHEIHQDSNKYLTLCPKHNGCFKDPECRRSKRPQPFSSRPAEVRAFRLKNRYMNLVISRYLGKPLEEGGWRE